MTKQPVPPGVRLEYGLKEPPAPRRRRWRVASLLAMLPGLVVPFVPFACDVSPAGRAYGAFGDLLEQGVWNCVAVLSDSIPWLSFFLAFPIVAWMTFRLRGRRSTFAGRAVCFSLGAVVGLGLIGNFARAVPEISRPWEYVFFGSALLPLVFSVAVVSVVAARRGVTDDCVTVMLVGPYAATIVLFLVGYVENAQIGWYLSLPPAAAAIFELIATGTFALRTDARARAPELSTLQP